MSQARATLIGTGAAVLLCGCAGPRGITPPRPAAGPLDIRIVYPRPAARRWEGSSWVFVADSGVRIQSRDSAFVFGSVGRGDARLLVNGRPVEVHPGGGWIAWLPLQDDSVARFELVAAAGTDVMRATYVVPLEPRFEPPWFGPWIDTTSFAPAGDLWVRPGEGIALAVRATPGASVRLVAADGRTVSMLPDRRPRPLPPGERAFGTVPRLAPGEPSVDRYVAWWNGSFGPDPGPVFSRTSRAEAPESLWVRVDVALDGDTARACWPLRVGTVDPLNPPVVVVDDDTAGTGLTDSSLAGRPVPYGTYHWFFPTGTVAAVSGRLNDQIRLQLSARSAAWVDAIDVHPLSAGTPPPRGSVGSTRLFADERGVTLRIPLAVRAPFAVEETERALRLTLYGVAADMDWMQYGEADDLVRLVSYTQPAADETIVTIELTEPVWGYRTRWSGNDLLLQIRRPPRIDPGRPLRGRRVAIDPGHPPLGATGPTGVREPDVTLAVAFKARELLARAGAEPILLRTSNAPLGLAERVMAAERADAEILVSIHANALPDGVNPFVNNGTSVYYFHPRSVELARAIDRALVGQFGFRDLGIGRGDLALARPTWMPAVLAEGLFLMIPEQEAVLASEDGQWRYARGIVEGIEAFLRQRAGQ